MIALQPPPAIPALSIRATNNDGTSNSNISSSAIIVIVLVASGFAVLVGYSTTRFFYNRNNSDEEALSNDDQARYMREVRLRNVQSLGGGHFATKEHAQYNAEEVYTPGSDIYTPGTERESYVSYAAK